jgi:hypothetical protein
VLSYREQATHVAPHLEDARAAAEPVRDEPLAFAEAGCRLGTVESHQLRAAVPIVAIPVDDIGNGDRSAEQ